MNLQFFGGRGANSKKKGVPLLVDGKLNPKIIDNLIADWQGNRWYKGEYDRLYPIAEDLRFDIETYKRSGAISYAEVKELPDIKGVDMNLVNYYTGKISHSKARVLTGYIRDTWIDLVSGEVKTKPYSKNDDWNFIIERVKYRLLEATRHVK